MVWLLKVISPCTIIGYYRLYYHRLFVVILLVANVGYSIGAYFINSYSIGGYWLFFYLWLLMVILLMAIDSYSIGDY